VWRQRRELLLGQPDDDEQPDDDHDDAQAQLQTGLLTGLPSRRRTAYPGSEAA
jgi:hypothetical protein